MGKFPFIHSLLLLLCALPTHVGCFSPISENLRRHASRSRSDRMIQSAATDSSEKEEKTTTSSPSSPLKPGQVLVASSLDPDSPVSFDSACVAYPVVIPPWKSGCNKWKMFYYGREDTWNGGHRAMLPTGWVGLAESDDGIRWTKVVGKEHGGSILAPSDDPKDFDHVHLGHGDIVPLTNDCWYMFYFGASDEPISMAFGDAVGFTMRIGRAVSRDQGLTWEKEGVVLDLDPSEGWFVSWPRIMIDKGDETKPWIMTYHTFNGENWRVYSAESTDQGKTWARSQHAEKEGQTPPALLSGAEDDENAWDYKGIGTRSMVPYKGGWLMVYEGVDKNTAHLLGTAFCESPDGAGPWQKQESATEPMLQPGVAPLREWTNLVIGTPHVILGPSPDDSEDDDQRPLWLYYVGVGNAEDDKKHAIGLVVSEPGQTKRWSCIDDLERK